MDVTEKRLSKKLKGFFCKTKEEGKDDEFVYNN